MSPFPPTADRSTIVSRSPIPRGEASLSPLPGPLHTYYVFQEKNKGFDIFLKMNTGGGDLRLETRERVQTNKAVLKREE